MSGGEQALEPDLEAQASEDGVAGRKFGTFGGVFTPTLLTILGVIMYLRLGWVVGNAGLLGAIGIILLAFGITLCTGLSLSSITTNIRIGGGGAYSVISRSLGIEIGGSIGIPLYISQGLAVSMYVFGFREGWLYVFPGHSAFLVDFAVFGVLFLVAFVSSGLAFRIQYLIMAVIVASLVSVAGAAVLGSTTEVPQLVGSFPGAPEDGFSGTSFWVVFAVFFPAATGIMAGANMSGDLRDPRQSIPKGTIGAIALSLVVYLILAYWLAASVPVDELVSNYTVMVDRALWPPAVVAGLLGATFSSALASLVGAPRILEALGAHDVLPRGEWLAERSRTGEPHRALLVTGAIVVAALMLRSLNAVAPLITMFFLITYAMVNVVVLVEQQLDLVSFRPLLRVHPAIPLVGAIGCVSTMFIINPMFGLVAIVLVVGLYAYLVRRSLDPPYGDVRSGLFYALSEWGARKAGALRAPQERAWKANLLVPVKDPRLLRRDFHFLRNIAQPKGTVRLLGLADPASAGSLDPALADVQTAFEDEDVFARTTSMSANAFDEGVLDAVQALRDTFFGPNVLYLPIPGEQRDTEPFDRVVEGLPSTGMGALFFRPDPDAGLGRRRRINLWIPDQGPRWRVGMELGNLDLAVLVAYKLADNWGARLRLVTQVDDPADREEAQAYLERLAQVARLPTDSERIVHEGSLEAGLEQVPEADLTVLPRKPGHGVERMREIADRAQCATVFTEDGGGESALA